jgi:hypothetical protein
MHVFAIFRFDGLADTNAPMATPLKSQVNGPSQQLLFRFFLEKKTIFAAIPISKVTRRILVVSREIVKEDPQK